MNAATFDGKQHALGPLGLRIARRWRDAGRRWIGPAISIAILVAVASRVGTGALAALRDAPADRPALWCAFLLFYAAPTTAEWLIFRHLWSLPPRGLAPLLRKQVANELVLGYSGDAQFYLWAKDHVRTERSPFKAVKDVAILSAVAGNLVTLTLMALCAPLLANTVSGPLGRALVLSVSVIAVSSLTLLGFRRTIFSLPRRELAFVFAMHVLRILVCLLLLAAFVHLLIPDVPARGLMVLATLRMMLSRLPLLPAKDAIFAGIVGVVFARQAEVASAVALAAALTIALHLVLGAAASILSLRNTASGEPTP